MQAQVSEAPWEMPYDDGDDDDNSDTDTDMDSATDSDFSTESESEAETPLIPDELRNGENLPMVGIDGVELIGIIAKENLYRVEIMAETEEKDEVVLFKKYFKKNNVNKDFIKDDGPLEELIKERFKRKEKGDCKLSLKKTIVNVRKTSIVTRATEFKIVSYEKEP